MTRLRQRTQVQPSETIADCVISEDDSEATLAALRSALDAVRDDRPDWDTRFKAARSLVAMLMEREAAAGSPQRSLPQDSSGEADEPTDHPVNTGDDLETYLAETARGLRAAAADPARLKQVVHEFVSSARARGMRSDQIISCFGVGPGNLLSRARLDATATAVALAALDSFDAFD